MDFSTPTGFCREGGGTLPAQFRIASSLKQKNELNSDLALIEATIARFIVDLHK